MKQHVGRLVSVHVGEEDEFVKPSQASVRIELDGFVGDRHRGYDRVAASYDPDPTGTVRRNERQWSGVSIEELATLSERLDLAKPLEATTLGANICVEGIPDFSRLPRGSRLVFPSGATLTVEMINPPCVDMAEPINAAHSTRSGAAVEARMIPKYAHQLRGVVGVVDVAGAIKEGDEVIVETAPS